MSQLHSGDIPTTPVDPPIVRHDGEVAVNGADVATKAEPTGVVLGAGGDPLIVGLPIFAVGSLALGMSLTGLLPVGALGAVVPIIMLATGLYLVVSTVWAAMLGQTIVAGIFGTFSGFWLSLGGLLLGLTHNWYGVPAAQVVATQEMFFIAWGCLFAFLLIPCLRLPAIYPLIVGLVVAALAFGAAGLHTGVAGLLDVAGYIILTFAFLGFCAFVNVGLTSMGAKKPWPPLGSPVIT